MAEVEEQTRQSVKVNDDVIEEEAIVESTEKMLKQEAANNYVQPKTGQPVQITWKNIFITANLPQGGCCGKKGPKPDPKMIINGVSGTVLPGQFVSIIGASGAGKTTLLNYLSGRDIAKNLNRSGEVTVNGVNRDEVANFSAFSAFVQQDDILFQTLTVRECLTFAARLKLPVTYDEQLARVEQIIKKLKLEKCQNTKIGGPTVKGVSGGERKRTSIGVELITDPNLIFLDEPTTGLDSFTATSVMETLKDLAQNEGRTVVSTIHQPNSDTFEAFDRLLLMAKGKIIYFNETLKAVDYFKSINFSCPDLCNPADYFMAMMSIESIEEEIEDQGVTFETPEQEKEEIALRYGKKIDNFAIQYESSGLKNDHDYIDPNTTPIDKDNAVVMASWCFQFKLLAQRNFLNTMRLPTASYVKIITNLITACFALVLYWQLPTTAAGVQSIQGALFFITMNMAFSGLNNIILVFPDERPVFLREVNNNMYNVSPYFWAKIATELPGNVINPVIFGCVVYYGIGFTTDQWYRFPYFLGINVLIYNASSGYSLVISSFIGDKQLAVTLTPVFIIPFMLFAGFFVNQASIPVWLIEFQYLSIFKYGYQALFLNQFDDNDTLQCQQDPKPCDPLQTYDSPQDLGMSCLALAIMYVGCYCISWLVLVKVSSKYS